MFNSITPMAKKMEQDLWERSIKKMMSDGGWTMDIDNDDKIGFVFMDEKGDKWIRDYDKKTRTFVHFNGDHKINLKQSFDA